MSGYQKKKHHKAYERQQTQLEETEQASEPDMAGMLELSDWEFRTTMINMLRDKVGIMQEQMGNVSREMKILGKNQKEMLAIKNTVTEIENAFGGLISRLDTAEERLSELENISIESSKPERQKEQRLKKQNRHPRTMG